MRFRTRRLSSTYSPPQKSKLSSYCIVLCSPGQRVLLRLHGQHGQVEQWLLLPWGSDRRAVLLRYRHFQVLLPEEGAGGHGGYLQVRLVTHKIMNVGQMICTYLDSRTVCGVLYRYTLCGVATADPRGKACT